MAVAIIIIVLALLSPSTAAEWTTFGPKWRTGTMDSLEVIGSRVVRLTSFSGQNLALGIALRVGLSGANGFMTDGKLSTEFNFLDDPQVLGRTLTLRLRRDHVVSRIIIRPGDDTAAEFPEHFIKGYQIDLAPDGLENDWLLVAKSGRNRHPVVDTAADSTWRRFDESGPVPAVGRYLRFTMTRQDLPNRVSIGEIEVYGEGFQIQGEYLSEVRDFGRPVNLGALTWEAEMPTHTRVMLQLRSSENGRDWPEWRDIAVLKSGEYTTDHALAPVRYAQFRMLVETDDPLATPEVSEVRIQYEQQLVVARASGFIEPREAAIGVPTILSYTANIVTGSGNRGVDLIALDHWGEVRGLRIDGVAVPEAEYSVADLQLAGVQRQGILLHLSPTRRINTSARLEVDFETAFLSESTEIGMILGTTATDVAHLQRVVADPELVRVAVTGLLDDLVPASSVRIVPRVVSPQSPGRIDFALARLNLATPVTVSVYDLSGRLVRRLLSDAPLLAGPVSVPWDGRDDDGRPLPPGHYFCRIEVDAQNPVTLLRLLGVAY